jgi:hypothetical protein
MFRKLLLVLFFVPLFLLAQDQKMKVYSSGDYGNKPLLYVALLTEEDVENIIPLFAAVSKSRITSIVLEPPLLSANRLRITTCSGYIMVAENQTCEGGEFYALQKNSSDEWEMAPESPIAWRY